MKKWVSTAIKILIAIVSLMCAILFVNVNGEEVNNINTRDILWEYNIINENSFFEEPIIRADVEQLL